MGGDESPSPIKPQLTELGFPTPSPLQAMGGDESPSPVKPQLTESGHGAFTAPDYGEETQSPKQLQSPIKPQLTESGFGNRSCRPN